MENTKGKIKFPVKNTSNQNSMNVNPKNGVKLIANWNPVAPDMEKLDLIKHNLARKQKIAVNTSSTAISAKNNVSGNKVQLVESNLENFKKKSSKSKLYLLMGAGVLATLILTSAIAIPLTSNTNKVGSIAQEEISVSINEKTQNAIWNMINDDLTSARPKDGSALDKELLSLGKKYSSDVILLLSDSIIAIDGSQKISKAEFKSEKVSETEYNIRIALTASEGYSLAQNSFIIQENFKIFPESNGPIDVIIDWIDLEEARDVFRSLLPLTAGSFDEIEDELLDNIPKNQDEILDQIRNGDKAIQSFSARIIGDISNYYIQLTLFGKDGYNLSRDVLILEGLNVKVGIETVWLNQQTAKNIVQSILPSTVTNIDALKNSFMNAMKNENNKTLVLDQISNKEGIADIFPTEEGVQLANNKYKLVFEIVPKNGYQITSEPLFMEVDITTYIQVGIDYAAVTTLLKDTLSETAYDATQVSREFQAALKSNEFRNEFFGSITNLEYMSFKSGWIDVEYSTWTYEFNFVFEANAGYTISQSTFAVGNIVIPQWENVYLSWNNYDLLREDIEREFDRIGPKKNVQEIWEGVLDSEVVWARHTNRPEVISHAYITHELIVQGRYDVTPEFELTFHFVPKDGYIIKNPQEMTYETAGIELIVDLIVDEEEIKKEFRHFNQKIGTSNVSLFVNLVDDDHLRGAAGPLITANFHPEGFPIIDKNDTSIPSKYRWHPYVWNMDFVPHVGNNTITIKMTTYVKYHLSTANYVIHDPLS